MRFEYLFLSIVCVLVAYGLGHHSGYKHASKLYREMYWKMSEEEVYHNLMSLLSNLKKTN